MKISGTGIIDTLRSGFTEPRRDALWGHIYLTPELETITESAAFFKLHRILQLGPAHLCYPGATHTRASHSFGVYHLTRRILLHLAEEGADAFLSSEGVLSMLCAALLHDAGHFPYAHSLKELPLSAHEALSARLVLSEPLKTLIGKAGASPELCAAIIDCNLETQSASSELRFYRKILSGALDPDKLDYLNRDARYCGVPYGAQDVDFVISMLHPHKERGIDIDSRGIPSVESVLFSKYLMYRSVYWHHRVRSATAMIKKAVFNGLSSGSIIQDELYGLTDEELFDLLTVRPQSSGLAQMVKEGRLFSLYKEFPFDETAQSEYADLSKRAALEEAAAREISRETGREIQPSQVVIDLPEEAVFDAELFIVDEDRAFLESSSFFDEKITGCFLKTLRKVKIFVNGTLPKYKPHIAV